MSFYYFFKNKSDVTTAVKKFNAWVTNKKGKSIKIFRTGNGMEFTNKQMEDFFKVNGVHHQTIIQHTPQQNGIAERNKTIIEKATCMLQESDLNKKF